MKRDLSCWALLAALALATGCALPQNSPFEDLSRHRPIVEPQTHVLPPAAMLAHPGPGVGGPGPGVIPPFAGGGAPGGVMQASFNRGCGGPGPCGGFPGYMGLPGGYAMGVASTSQLAFIRPDGMSVSWDVSQPGAFDSEPLVVPGRFNFPQGAIYRLKLTNIPARPGVELYPTVEIGFATPRTEAFLAHNSIPIEFTDEDLDQVLTGNFVTKVIFLPDPEFQELAVAGVETLVSTRLDPGLDPIVEASRRGSIMAIIRLGNKDLQVPAAAGVIGPNGAIVPTGFHAPMACGPAGCGNPGGAPMGCGPMGCGQMGGVPPGYVAGVTAPTYGMPITGTPIGLPGPPHIPLGVPAGLQSHVMENHTHMHIPGPTEQVRIDVKQEPGLSYPQPASHVRIVEKAGVPPYAYGQPAHEQFQVVPAAPGCATGSDCADGQ